MPTPITTGLLAYGLSGRVFHAPFLTTHAGFQLVAVTERHQRRVHLRYPEVRSYPSVEALLANPAVELVVVNTPNNLHFAHAQLALRAGKHVLIEKPLAASPAEVRALVALGREVNRHVFAYQNRRWDSDFRAVQAVVASGRLGRLVEAHFRFDRFRLSLNSKTFKEAPGPGAGLRYDLGPHVLDQALHLFGPPAQALALHGSYRPGSQVDDQFALHLRYPAGLTVTVSSSLLVARPGPAYVLHGTGGTFRKYRADPQEAQLGQGLSPLDPAYGHEDRARAGELTLVGADGQLTTEAVATPVGQYGALFDALYQTLRHGVAYPISEVEQFCQAELLALAPPPGWD